MGKVRILESKGGGLYRVEVLPDLSTPRGELARMRSRLAGLPGKIVDADARRRDAEAALEAFRVSGGDDPAAQSAELARLAADLFACQRAARDLRGEQSELTVKAADLEARLAEVRTMDMWCADLTEDLLNEKASLEIDNDLRSILLRPGYNGRAAYDPARDGACVPAWATTPAALYYNWAMFPAWQKWNPRHRVGRVTAVDVAADRLDVVLDDARSRSQGLPINVGNALSAVPVEYMDCGAVAFQEGDRVVVEFSAQRPDRPKVVGFESHPVGCQPIVFAILVERDWFLRSQRSWISELGGSGDLVADGLEGQLSGLVWGDVFARVYVKVDRTGLTVLSASDVAETHVLEDAWSAFKWREPVWFRNVWDGPNPEACQPMATLALGHKAVEPTWQGAHRLPDGYVVSVVKSRAGFCAWTDKSYPAGAPESERKNAVFRLNEPRSWRRTCRYDPARPDFVRWRWEMPEAWVNAANARWSVQQGQWVPNPAEVLLGYGTTPGPLRIPEFPNTGYNAWAPWELVYDATYPGGGVGTDIRSGHGWWSTGTFRKTCWEITSEFGAVERIYSYQMWDAINHTWQHLAVPPGAVQLGTALTYTIADPGPWPASIVEVLDTEPYYGLEFQESQDAPGNVADDQNIRMPSPAVRQTFRPVAPGSCVLSVESLGEGVYRLRADGGVIPPERNCRSWWEREQNYALARFVCDVKFGEILAAWIEPSETVTEGGPLRDGERQWVSHSVETRSPQGKADWIVRQTDHCYGGFPVEDDNPYDEEFEQTVFFGRSADLSAQLRNAVEALHPNGRIHAPCLLLPKRR